jgi:hypothetical protein
MKWRRYVIPSTGASVDMPSSIFSRDGGPSEIGDGQRFFTDDNRADLIMQSIPNVANDSPATFLAKKRPPAGIIYKRIAPDFLVSPAFARTGSGTTAAIAARAS